MPNLSCGALFPHRHSLWHRIEPRAIHTLDLILRENLPPRADKAVAGGELSSTPGDRVPLVDRVKPERDFRHLAGDGIEVYAVDTVVGEISFHLLLLEQVIVVSDHASRLALLALEVSVGQLVHG